MTREARCAAAVLTATVLLAACGGERDAAVEGGGDGPDRRSTPTASSPTSQPTSDATTSTETSTETPPVMPPEAQAPDADGAATFIRYYFDTVNYAYRTGDLGPTQLVRQDDCTACLSLEEEIAAGFAMGGRIVAAQVSVEDIAVTPGDLTAYAEALAVLSQESGEIVDSAGDHVGTIDPEVQLAIGANLERSPTGWLISQWGNYERS